MSNKTKDPELAELEEAVKEAGWAVQAAQEALDDCEEAHDAAKKALKAFFAMPEPSLLFGSGVFVDGFPALVLSRWKDSLELIVDDPAGIYEVKVQYRRGENRIQAMPFDDGVALFDRFREMERI